ncbi:MAG TPA: Uma2 family endonuclease [Gemmataceae bacterium]|nr:Uma2 family endonuclease [Gemmataceae bacterium]
MITFIDETNEIRVPSWVVDLDSFCRWADADDFPEHARVWYIKGEVWVDMSREQLFSHLAMKQEFNFVLGGLAKVGKLGLFFPDGLFLSNVHADIGGNPDGTFIATRTVESGAVRLIEGAEGGYVELEGSPDMVLEVISRSSVRKDTVLLKQAYWEAEIPEYWLVDARKEPLKFDILRHTPKGYVATRKQGGWLKSAVFGKSFQLTQSKSVLGHPEFTLAVR